MWWRWGSCFMQMSVCRPLVDAISVLVCSLREDFETCIFCCHGARIRWAPHGLGWRHILATRKPAWVKQHVTNERRMLSLLCRDWRNRCNDVQLYRQLRAHRRGEWHERVWWNCWIWLMWRVCLWRRLFTFRAVSWWLTIDIENKYILHTVSILLAVWLILIVFQNTVHHPNNVINHHLINITMWQVLRR